VTAQVLMMTLSATAVSVTISCPAAKSWRAIVSISLWFRRQPMLFR